MEKLHVLFPFTIKLKRVINNLTIQASIARPEFEILLNSRKIENFDIFFWVGVKGMVDTTRNCTISHHYQLKYFIRDIHLKFL